MNLGAHVYLAARSQEKGEGAVRKLKEGRGEGEKEGDVEWLRLDLNSLESVRGCAEEFLGKEVPLHVLINNAGLLLLFFVFFLFFFVVVVVAVVFCDNLFMEFNIYS